MSHQYYTAKSQAIAALATMTEAMKDMGAEHANFHNHFGDVQKRLQAMEKDIGGKELHVEVVRSTALDRYISGNNQPKVTALGHFEIEKALTKFRLQEKELDEIQKKTAMLVDKLLGDRRCKCGDGQGAMA